jgi:hypothetical protein
MAPLNYDSINVKLFNLVFEAILPFELFLLKVSSRTPHTTLNPDHHVT